MTRKNSRKNQAGDEDEFSNDEDASVGSDDDAEESRLSKQSSKTDTKKNAKKWGEKDSSENVPWYRNKYYIFFGLLFFLSAVGCILGYIFGSQETQPVFSGILGFLFLVVCIYACCIRCCANRPATIHHHHHHPPPSRRQSDSSFN